MNDEVLTGNRDIYKCDMYTRTNAYMHIIIL